MESQDFPIQHFEMMQELATCLKTVPVQILVHQYDYDAFGSWWIEFMRSGQRFRIIFDGKEQNLRLETSIGNQLKVEWQEMIVEEVPDESPEVIITRVRSLLDTP